MDVNNGTTFGKIVVLPLKGEKGDSGDAGDYSALTNKPSINNVQLSGNLSSDDLGIASQASVVALSNLIDDNAEEAKVLIITRSAVSALPTTISNANITSDMVVVKAELSNSKAQTGDWSASTSTGSLTISGSINGSTDVTLYLMHSR